ncbi:hypothetical protein HDU93_005407 [Gonapodya sp. JEL0774]|nr:hypothetical protein HDU93_005407 [Gonapodya sp. JEL0774]
MHENLIAHAESSVISSYIPFIAVVGSLYVMAGGLVLRGTLSGRPAVNTALLAFGTVLSSLVGVTGASMVMIRPVVRSANRRKDRVHCIVFFIILVSNVGGTMTPIGNPPVFMGFLKGVDFFWPLLNCSTPTVFTSIVLLLMFYLIDSYLFSREQAEFLSKAVDEERAVLDELVREPSAPNGSLASLRKWASKTLSGGLFGSPKPTQGEDGGETDPLLGPPSHMSGGTPVGVEPDLAGDKMSKQRMSEPAIGAAKAAEPELSNIKVFCYNNPGCRLEPLSPEPKQNDAIQRSGYNRAVGVGSETTLSSDPIIFGQSDQKDEVIGELAPVGQSESQVGFGILPPREPSVATYIDPTTEEVIAQMESISASGLVNIVGMAVVAFVIVLSGILKKEYPDSYFTVMKSPRAGSDENIQWFYGDLFRDTVMVLATVIAMKLTPEENYRANRFTWDPIVEVSTLFLGIFLNLSPILLMFDDGPSGAMGWVTRLVDRPATYFWATGILSSFLDNAPTYVLFFGAAGGNPAELMTQGAKTLAAITCGAVFMGANTYIGNAPNMLVRSIAVENDIEMPSFFGYMGWTLTIFLPVLILDTNRWLDGLLGTAEKDERYERKLLWELVNSRAGIFGMPNPTSVIPYHLEKEPTPQWLLAVNNLVSNIQQDSFTAMSSHERALIEAVEAGSVHLVKKALADGSDPNARKKITLRCDVRVGKRPLGKQKVRSNLFRADVFEERFEDVFDVKTESVLGESALGLAIFTGIADVVTTLLEAGADPNTAIEWPNANTVPTWTPERWNKTRWVRTYRADSPLILAIGRGVKVTDFDGASSAWGALADKGKLRISKVGGEVRLVNPESWTQAYRECEIAPRPDIIGILLRYGARVTRETYEAAKRTDNKNVVDLLDPYILDLSALSPTVANTANLSRKASSRNPSGYYPRSPSPNNSPSSPRPPSLDIPGTNVSNHGDMALSRLLVDQMRQNDELRREIRSLQAASAEKSAHSAALEHQATELKDRNAELERELLSLRRQLAEQTARLQAAGSPVDMSSKHRDEKKLMTVTTPFMPTEPDEILLEFGNTVSVNWNFDDGWAAGLNITTGQSGLFPLACLSSGSTSHQTVSSSFSRRTASISSSSTLIPSPPYIPYSTSPSSTDLLAAVLAKQGQVEAKVAEGMVLRGNGNVNPTSPKRGGDIGEKLGNGFDTSSEMSSILELVTRNVPDNDM